MVAVHHVVLTQSGGGTAKFEGADFGMTDTKDWDSTLNVGDELTITAKAASEDGEAIAGISFLWEPADATVLAVTDDGANTGMIEAISSGSTKVKVTLEDRGIDIEFNIVALSEVKFVRIDSPKTGHYLNVGESVALAATAFDSEEDQDSDNVVETDLLEFRSSNTSVISIDGKTATAEGAGYSDITAHVGNVKSKAVRIHVSPSGDTTHKLTFTRIAESKLTITRTVVDASADPLTYTYSGGNAATPDGSLSFTVHVRNLTDNKVDDGVTANTGMSVRVQGDDGVIGTVPDTTTGITVATGVVTITIAADGWGVPGTAKLIMSYDSGSNYAEDLVLPAVTVEDAEE